MQSGGKSWLMQNKRRTGGKWNLKLRFSGKPVCCKIEKGNKNWCQVLYVHGVLQRGRLKGPDGNQKMESQLWNHPDNHETAGPRIQWHDLRPCHSQRP